MKTQKKKNRDSIIHIRIEQADKRLLEIEAQKTERSAGSLARQFIKNGIAELKSLKQN